MASGRYAGFNIDSKCGQDNYRNCTLHNSMRLKSDGYYECPLCGYKVLSSSLQDKAILSNLDYLKVIALEYAYSIMLAQVDEYGIYFHDLWDKIYQIRIKSEYINKYDYCNGEGKCLFIPPEIDPTGVSYPNSTVGDPVLITNDNINWYNGIFNEIINTAMNTIYGFVFPSSLAQSIALAVDDYIRKENSLSSFNSVLQALVSGTDAAGFGYILQLLELGANINELEQVAEIEVGDIVVQIQFPQAMATYNFYVVFNQNLELKNIYSETNA